MNLRLVVVIGGNNIMVHLIDKTAVVEELERLYNLEYDNTSNLSCGKKIMLRNILSFLDTLEVKDVDLLDGVHGTVDFPFIGYDFPNIYPNYKELKEYCNRKGIKDNDKVKMIIIKDA